MMGVQGENNSANKVFGNISGSMLKKNDLPVVLCVPENASLNFTRQLALILNKEKPFFNSRGWDLLTALGLDTSSLSIQKVT